MQVIGWKPTKCVSIVRSTVLLKFTFQEKIQVLTKKEGSQTGLAIWAYFVLDDDIFHKYCTSKNNLQISLPPNCLSYLNVRSTYKEYFTPCGIRLTRNEVNWSGVLFFSRRQQNNSITRFFCKFSQLSHIQDPRKSQFSNLIYKKLKTSHGLSWGFLDRSISSFSSRNCSGKF